MVNRLSPNRLVSYIRNVLSDGESPHFYHRECAVPDDEFVSFVRELTGSSPQRILKTRERLLDDQDFQEAIEHSFQRTEYRPDSLHRNWREILYSVVVLTTPETVVETGVYDGLSSAYILKAMSDVGSGELISVDIGDTKPLPNDLDVRPGWVVPETLHNRWRLKFGDSKDILPDLAESEEISMFLHDSLHTEEHMRFEFNAAIKAMASGDIFLSDNVSFNDVFDKFAAEYLEEPLYLRNTTENYDYDGNQIDDRLGGGLVR